MSKEVVRDNIVLHCYHPELADTEPRSVISSSAVGLTMAATWEGKVVVVSSLPGACMYGDWVWW